MTGVTGLYNPFIDNLKIIKYIKEVIVSRHTRHLSKNMVKHNFKNPEEFADLERNAYDGQLDFNEFPAAEYRYFDRIQDIGYRSRHEGLAREQARSEREKAQALRDYDAWERGEAIAHDYFRRTVALQQVYTNAVMGECENCKKMFGIMTGLIPPQNGGNT